MFHLSAVGLSAAIARPCLSLCLVTIRMFPSCSSLYSDRTVEEKARGKACSKWPGAHSDLGLCNSMAAHGLTAYLGELTGTPHLQFLVSKTLSH